MSEISELRERARRLLRESIELRKKSEGLEDLRKTLHEKHKEFEKKFAEFTEYFEKEKEIKNEY